jgi:hypothetical protein
MMSSGSRNRKRHLGMDFAVWSSGRSWFWLLINVHGEAGTIGASSNEAQATRDAYLFIEEILQSSEGNPKNSPISIPLKTTVGSAHAFC